MTDTAANAAAKQHPATREIMPEDPMEMRGHEMPGDTDLMLRLLVEEYARIGWGLEEIMNLARDPNYRTFHGLWQLYGEEAVRHRVQNILSQCGVMRVNETETQSIPEQVVQIELPK